MALTSLAPSPVVSQDAIDSFIADIESMLAAAAPDAAGIAAGIEAAPILLIVGAALLVAMIVLLLLAWVSSKLYVTIYNGLYSLPVVGHTIAGLFHWAYELPAHLSHLVESWAMKEALHAISSVAAFIRGIAIAVVQPYAGMIGQANARIQGSFNIIVSMARSLGVNGEMIWGAVHDLTHMVDVDVKGILTWLTNQVRTQYRYIEKLTYTVDVGFKHLEGQIHRTDKNLHDTTVAFKVQLAKMAQEIEHLQHDNIWLKQQVTTLSQELHNTNTQLKTTTGNVDKLLPLTVVALVGVTGIRNLVDLARDPCKCLNPGGGYQWMAPLVIANTVGAT